MDAKAAKRDKLTLDEAAEEILELSDKQGLRLEQERWGFFMEALKAILTNLQPTPSIGIDEAVEERNERAGAAVEEIRRAVRKSCDLTDEDANFVAAEDIWPTFHKLMEEGLLTRLQPDTAAVLERLYVVMGSLKNGARNAVEAMDYHCGANDARLSCQRIVKRAIDKAKGEDYTPSTEECEAAKQAKGE